MLPYFQKLFKYRGLLYEMVVRDLKVKYRGSFLGYLWSLLNPLMMMMVMSTVFAYLFRYTIPNYTMYVLSGQILFAFFSESTNLSMHSVLAGGALMRKVYVPKYIFPLSRVLSSIVNMIFSLGAIIIMLIITRTPITAAIVMLPISILYIAVFALGVSLVLSSLTVFFRDIIHLYGVLLTAWMYLTPIFYPESILPSGAMAIMSLNPLFYFISHFRTIVVYGAFPTMHLNFICMIFAVSALALGLYVFKKKQDEFIFFI